MIRIGAVNPDTSHLASFAKYLHTGQRARYAAVYNDGITRSDEAIEKMVADHQMEKRCRTLSEMADMVDVAFIHGCNWNKHLHLAEPFVRKGKPVFIDKPIVGSIADCRKLEAWARDGAVILGSSSLRYCNEVRAFRAKPDEERGKIVSMLGTVGSDEFNYAVHIVELFGGLVGTGAVACRCVGSGEVDGRRCETFFVRFASGITAVYNNFHEIWQPCEVVIMTTKTTFQFRVDTAKLYGALLDQVLDQLETGHSLLVDAPTLTESIKIMLAGRLSRARGGIEIKLAEIPEDDPGFDGDAFEKFYAKR